MLSRHVPSSSAGSSALNRLWRGIAPSIAEGDEDTARTARILFILLVVGLALDAVMGLATVLFYPRDSYGSLIVINGPRVLVFLGLLLFMRSGSIRVASTVFVLSLWVFTSIGVGLEGGLRSPMFTLFFPLILIAALLLGWRFAVLVAALSVGTAVAVYLVESSADPLIQSVSPSVERLWSGYLVSLAIVVSVALLANSELRRSNRALRSEIKERRALEEQLLHSQRMEAVGHLASGLAHDVNNHLTVISAHCETVGSSLQKGSKAEEQVGRAMEAVARASKLARQLLVFSRSDKPNPKLVDLNRLIGEAVAMLRPTLGRNVTLSTELTPDLDPVQVDPTQLQQVVLNLAINACDAMPSGGTLLIGTGNGQPRSSEPLPPGRYVTLTIQDTGEGMSSEVRSQAFEPFFTTKAPGAGTGLGLAVVNGIVHEAGGHISLESEPALGTTFRIHLPCVSADPGVARAHSAGESRAIES